MMPESENVPTVVITLDRARRLAFTLGAMRRIKARLGTLDFDGGADETVEKLGTYVWACLTKEDREGLDVEAVEDMIHAGNLEAVSATIGGLMQESTPETKGAEGNARAAAPGKKGKPRKSTSTRSGQPASTTSA